MAAEPHVPDLETHPRAAVAVDLAVLTVLPPDAAPHRIGRLAVLLLDRQSTPAGRVVPGRFLRERTTIAQTVTAILTTKMGLPALEVTPTLLRVFDDPDRDARTWALSLAHSIVLPWSTVSSGLARPVLVEDDGTVSSETSLPFDHAQIVRHAVRHLRDEYEVRPDPAHLLDDRFTLAELRTVHEAVLGAPLLKDTFTRRMSPALTPVTDDAGEPVRRRAGGRPAQLFTRTDDDASGAEARLRLPRG